VRSIVSLLEDALAKPTARPRTWLRALTVERGSGTASFQVAEQPAVDGLQGRGNVERVRLSPGSFVRPSPVVSQQDEVDSRTF
jgi:hypothetical protein